MTFKAKHILTVALGFIVALSLLQCSRMDKPRITIQTSSGNVEFQVEIAASAQERRRGLMERQQLGQHEGMLFIFPALSLTPFWMENTPLALDILFIGEDLRIDEIFAETTPYSRELIQPKQAYRYVLEVRGGTAASMGLRIGDRIKLPNTLQNNI